jgi:hypothetical protein
LEKKKAEQGEGVGQLRGVAMDFFFFFFFLFCGTGA